MRALMLNYKCSLPGLIYWIKWKEWHLDNICTMKWAWYRKSCSNKSNCLPVVKFPTVIPCAIKFKFICLIQVDVVVLARVSL